MMCQWFNPIFRMFFQVVFIFGCVLSPSAAPVYAEVSCQIADRAITAASRIRGLRHKKRVPCVVQGKAEVKKYILHAIGEQLPPEKLRYEEQLYKALGLLPEDFDYKKGIVNLYLSQIGGYYDPKKSRYVMAKWIPEAMQETVAVHELTHALQDHYYNLQQFVDDPHAHTDEMLARAALIEGDATAVMLDHPRQLMGLSSIASLDNVDSLVMQQVMSVMMSQDLRSVPDSLKLTALFPYASGLRFAHSLLRKGGYRELDKAFGSMPKTTEVILHPEKFGAQRSDYRILKGEALLKSMGFDDAPIDHQDIMGEFLISLMLAGDGSHKQQAAQAAAGWGGDLAIITHDNNFQYVIHKIRWDTHPDTEQFMHLFKKILRRRFRVDIGSTWTSLPGSVGAAALIKQQSGETIFAFRQKRGKEEAK